MKVYYTCVCGGMVKKFPEKINQRDAVKELKNNRVKDEETKVCLSSLLGWTVHSLFFIDKNMVKKIWDSSLNGFRPIKLDFIIPDKILKEINDND